MKRLNEAFVLLLVFSICNSFDLSKESKPTISCSPFKGEYKLQAKGEFVKISEISNVTCPGEIKFIEIFALRRVIIDEDIIKIGEEMQVNILAPVWKIVSNRTISLNGTNADNTGRIDETDCATTGLVAPSGVPGLPGGPGGFFFGLVTRMIDGQNLKITSNGGNGTSGQPGCNGIATEERLVFAGEGGQYGLGGIHGQVKLFSLNESLTIDAECLARNGSRGERKGKGGTTPPIFFSRDKAQWNPDDYLPYEDLCKIYFQRESYCFRPLANTKGYKYPKEPVILEEFSESVRRYKKFVFNSVFITGKRKYTPLYNRLKNNTQLPSYYSILYFIEELTEIENSYSVHLNRSRLLVMLNEWTRELEEYKDFHPNERTDNSNEVIRRLTNLVSIRKSKLEGNTYEFPILQVQNTLQAYIKISKTLTNANALVTIASVSSKFQKKFLDDIEEANRFINKELKDDMDKCIKELNDEINKLIQEVEELTERKEQEVENLKIKREDLKKKIAIRAVFAVFQVLFLALSFVNPACAIVGTLLSISAATFETQLLDSSGSTINKTIALPPGVQSTMKESFKTFAESKKKGLDLVDKKLEEIRIEKEKYPEILEGGGMSPLTNVEEKLVLLRQDLESGKVKDSDGTRRMQSILENEEDKWSRVKERKDKSYKTQLKFINRANNAIKASELGVDYTNKIQNDVSRKNQLDVMIDQSLEGIKQLKSFKVKVQNYLQPKIERIGEEIVKKTSQFGDVSLVNLIFQEWQLNEYLTDVSKQLETYTEKFNVSGSIKTTMSKFKNGIGTVIRLHEVIKDFQSEIRNSEYLRDLVSTQFQISSITDKELSHALTKLVHIHYANGIIDEYKMLKNALLQYTFPMTSVLPHLTKYSITTLKDPLREAYNIISEMETAEEELSLNTRNMNKTRKVATFGCGDSLFSLSSFYTWNSSYHATEIRELLKGKTVKLFANISEHKGLNSVKFSDVSIVLTSADSKVNEELKTDLRKFSAILTHNGDSYYRCDDKVFLIKAGSIQLESKFVVSRNNTCFDDKERNDYVLSPYATWFVRLTNDGNNFDLLDKYVNRVQLKLVGKGEYIPLHMRVCRKNVTAYYGEEIVF